MIRLQKLPKNVGDLDKLIVAKGFEKLPKDQKSPNLVTLVVSDISYQSAKRPVANLINNLRS